MSANGSRGRYGLAPGLSSTGAGHLKGKAVPWVNDAGAARVTRGCRSAVEPLHRPPVIAEIDVALGRYRLALLPLDFGAKGEQVAEALGVEGGVDVEAERRVDQKLIGALRHRLRQVELVDQQADRLDAVRRVAHPPQRLDIGREVAFERRAVLMSPLPHHEGAARLNAT